MSNISDVIESFILKTMGEDNQIEISRNELASFFLCAPSQINYVLETRFTIDKGFVKESKRGGGGSIKLIKIQIEEDEYINDLILNSIGDELSFKRATHILNKLKQENIITAKDETLIKIMISDDSLSLPVVLKDKLRANIFKNMLLLLLKERNNG